MVLQGRVLIFQAKEGKLRLVAQKHVNGAVFTIAAFQVLSPTKNMCSHWLTFWLACIACR